MSHQPRTPTRTQLLIPGLLVLGLATGCGTATDSGSSAATPATPDVVASMPAPPGAVPTPAAPPPAAPPATEAAPPPAASNLGESDGLALESFTTNSQFGICTVDARITNTEGDEIANGLVSITLMKDGTNIKVSGGFQNAAAGDTLTVSLIGTTECPGEGYEADFQRDL